MIDRAIEAYLTPAQPEEQVEPQMEQEEPTQTEPTQTLAARIAMLGSSGYIKVGWKETVTPEQRESE